eukprot:CAMPEP_0182589840 /NCGR_PEP_ID=MMETSP1324-20130603/70376_1 /TAXON_ID=236786 /ORGANISM="Florenciella sp., Strain RCC1587" /LENGTH=171 /DNA_ID=CAMNT_0024807013 /DNA_START=136 /DNA_END=648 /DNA_ORIENTATION=+
MARPGAGSGRRRRLARPCPNNVQRLSSPSLCAPWRMSALLKAKGVERATHHGTGPYQLALIVRVSFAAAHALVITLVAILVELVTGPLNASEHEARVAFYRFGATLDHHQADWLVAAAALALAREHAARQVVLLRVHVHLELMLRVRQVLDAVQPHHNLQRRVLGELLPLL